MTLCPFCRTDVGSSRTSCSACGLIYHDDCWAEGGGCVIVGCTGNSETPPTSVPGHTPRQFPGAAFPSSGEVTHLPPPPPPLTHLPPPPNQTPPPPVGYQPAPSSRSEPGTQKFCTGCGGKLNADDAFCGSCGTKRKN